ncbi:MAG: OmpA family protein [Candidatus Binatia bacterium]
MKILRLFVVPIGLWVALASAPRQVLADEYDDSQSHPLRVVAYIAHPLGVLLEWVAARPFHALVSGTKELEYLYGHRPHPPIFTEPQPTYNFGVPKRVPMKQAAPPKKAVSQEPTAERVTIREVSVEKTVLKEVPKIVEVERVVFPDIAFRFDSAQLTELGKGKAYLVAQKLKERSDILVAVEGHADYIGTDEYNQLLGLHRAEMVMKELAQLGIDPVRMSVASLGESKPVVDQETDWARAVNRRVEFKITSP